MIEKIQFVEKPTSYKNILNREIGLDQLQNLFENGKYIYGKVVGGEIISKCLSEFF